jgi:hypothetical protein
LQVFQTRAGAWCEPDARNDTGDKARQFLWIEVLLQIGKHVAPYFSDLHQLYLRASEIVGCR